MCGNLSAIHLLKVVVKGSTFTCADAIAGSLTVRCALPIAGVYLQACWPEHAHLAETAVAAVGRTTCASTYQAPGAVRGSENAPPYAASIMVSRYPYDYCDSGSCEPSGYNFDTDCFDIRMKLQQQCVCSGISGNEPIMKSGPAPCRGEETSAAAGASQLAFEQSGNCWRH